MGASSRRALSYGRLAWPGGNTLTVVAVVQSGQEVRLYRAEAMVGSPDIILAVFKKVVNKE